MSALPNHVPTASMLHCPACGRTTAQDFLYAKNGCDILRCMECGIGRTDAASFNPASYYTEDYFAGGYDDGYADYRGAEPVLRKEFARVVDFVREHKAGGRLLDVGCAYGFFLQEAKPYFDVAGIEIAPEAAKHARESGLNVVEGIADEPTLAKLGQFDVIVLLDVIEHLPDPHETLALCDRHLNPGGIIVITTGDFGSQYARLAGSNWRLMTPPQHLWFFTQESMQRIAARLGLTVDGFAHPWKVVPISLIAYQLKRILGIRPAAAAAGSRLGVPGQPVRRNARRDAEADMNASLTIGQIGLLSAYAIGMAGGQLLFKGASLRLAAGAPLGERLMSLVVNPYFIAALALYLALSVFWVWILSFTPLSRAYPFVALAFAITPFLGAAIFAEALSTRLVIGLGVIVVGLILVAE